MKGSGSADSVVPFLLIGEEVDVSVVSSEHRRKSYRARGRNANGGGGRCGGGGKGGGGGPGKWW